MCVCVRDNDGVNERERETQRARNPGHPSPGPAWQQRRRQPPSSRKKAYQQHPFRSENTWNATGRQEKSFTATYRPPETIRSSSRVHVCVCVRDNEGVSEREREKHRERGILVTHHLALLGSSGGGSRLLLGRKLISSILFDLKTRGTRLDDKKKLHGSLPTTGKQFDQLKSIFFLVQETISRHTFSIDNKKKIHVIPSPGPA
jgi:hypothetical protein